MSINSAVTCYGVFQISVAVVTVILAKCGNRLVGYIPSKNFGPPTVVRQLFIRRNV